jgi:hypothetical protein
VTVACHWYSATDLTVMLVRMAATVRPAQAGAVPTLPMVTDPVTDELRTVAQLMVADPPTTSVRYG